MSESPFGKPIRTFRGLVLCSVEKLRADQKTNSCELLIINQDNFQLKLLDSKKEKLPYCREHCIHQNTDKSKGDLLTKNFT